MQYLTQIEDVFHQSLTVKIKKRKTFIPFLLFLRHFDVRRRPTFRNLPFTLCSPLLYLRTLVHIIWSTGTTQQLPLYSSYFNSEGFVKSYKTILLFSKYFSCTTFYFFFKMHIIIF